MKIYDDGVPFSKNFNQSSCMGRIFSASMSVRGGFLVRQTLHETYFCRVSPCMGHIFDAAIPYYDKKTIKMTRFRQKFYTICQICINFSKFGEV